MFKGHPKGLIAAALSNMGERFGYYIMNAVLLLFLCSKFGISDGVAAVIYAVFYFSIYVMSLPGGAIADKLRNYKGTIIAGLITMAAGYLILSIPIMATPTNNTIILTFTCIALLIIAFGNGLFKGNLQAIVGQMYDNLEAEAEKTGDPQKVEFAKSRRDPGFQIFYVFINIGGVMAPFVAPFLRQWWLKIHGFIYNAGLPAYCHQFINDSASMSPAALQNMNELVQSSIIGGQMPADMMAFSSQYLEVFNQGIHYSFIASILAMLISLVIFLACKKRFPTPAKRSEKVIESYTPEERLEMAKEIKQRMAALFAVLGICVFFWMSFHQNGQSLSLFARDFVNTQNVAPEVWQFLNPFLVIILTPVIMLIFSTKRGRTVSTPRKIVIGMMFAGLAYLFLAIFSAQADYPSGEAFRAMAVSESERMKAGAWVLLVTYFFLTVAELFISPLGLSFVSKIAPKHIQGMCQGLWLSATAIGNLLIMLGPIFYDKLPNLWICWGIFMAICFIAMGVMRAMLKWLERITQ